MALSLVPEHVAPLEKAHDRKSFDCGNDDLNRYLREQARQDADKRVVTSQAPWLLMNYLKKVCQGMISPTLDEATLALGREG